MHQEGSIGSWFYCKVHKTIWKKKIQKFELWTRLLLLYYSQEAYGMIRRIVFSGRNAHGKDILGSMQSLQQSLADEIRGWCDCKILFEIIVASHSEKRCRAWLISCSSSQPRNKRFSNYIMINFGIDIGWFWQRCLYGKSSPRFKNINA